MDGTNRTKFEGSSDFSQTTNVDIATAAKLKGSPGDISPRVPIIPDPRETREDFMELPIEGSCLGGSLTKSEETYLEGGETTKFEPKTHDEEDPMESDSETNDSIPDYHKMFSAGGNFNKSDDSMKADEDTTVKLDSGGPYTNDSIPDYHKMFATGNFNKSEDSAKSGEDTSVKLESGGLNPNIDDSIPDYQRIFAGGGDFKTENGTPRPEVGVITFDFSDIIHRKKRKPRKLVNRSLEDKYRAINAVEGGTMKSEVARVFGVPANTLSTWLKHREKIKYAVETNGFSEHRRKMRTGKHENVNSVLYAWYTEACRMGIPVNGPMLQQKAREFALALGEDEFTGSTGWLCRFKDRHNIAFRMTGGQNTNNCATNGGKLGEGSSGTNNRPSSEQVDWFSTSDNAAEMGSEATDCQPPPLNGLPNYEETAKLQPEEGMFHMQQKNILQQALTPINRDSSKYPSLTMQQQGVKRTRHEDDLKGEGVIMPPLPSDGTTITHGEESNRNNIALPGDNGPIKVDGTAYSPRGMDTGLVPRASEFLELCGRMRLFMYCHKDMAEGLGHLSNIEQLFARVCTKK